MCLFFLPVSKNMAFDEDSGVRLGPSFSQRILFEKKMSLFLEVRKFCLRLFKDIYVTDIALLMTGWQNFKLLRFPSECSVSGCFLYL